MILEEITLQDFRCFYGEAVIEFSTDPIKNVTLIYAENGLGKTTILNALLWCFYGETTERFEKKDSILNFDAIKAGRKRASVEVKFEHESKRYVARRYFGSRGAASMDREFVVMHDDRGNLRPIATADTFINSVIPREMASHFLFDGEHAEVFVGEDARDSVRSAIRDILGCSLVETAINDLTALSNQFRKQIPSTDPNDETSRFNREIDDLQTQRDEADKLIKEAETQKAHIREQISDIDTKLRNTAAAKELQKSRERLTASLERAARRQKEAQEEVHRWLGENGRFIVSKKITEETLDFLDEKEHRGRIPSPYNEEFVKDILQNGTCICGALLPHGSDAARQVADLLNRAANQVMRERITKVRSRISNLKANWTTAPKKLTAAQEKLSEANQEHAQYEAQIAEIHEKLKGIDFDDIASRERKRAELGGDLSKLDQTIGRIKGNVEAADKRITELNRALTASAQKNKDTAVYLKRRTLCEALKGELELALNEEEQEARSVLRASIKRILQTTSRKAFNFHMADDYVISLRSADGTALPKSSGENQLLGLAFTAALVEFAKIRQGAKDYKLLPGTIAPLVLDSPFGSLDPAYQITTAEFMPAMGRQVVLLFTRSQGSPEILDKLRDRIGAEYALIRHNKEPAGQRLPEVRIFHGKEVRTAVFESEYDGTEIRELSAA